MKRFSLIILKTSCSFFLLLGFLLIAPTHSYSQEQEPDLSVCPADGEGRVCFCHNVNHNPHTICTSVNGAIQGHERHVNNGEDFCGRCEDMGGDGDGDGGPGGEEPPNEPELCSDELLLNGDFETVDDRVGLVHGNSLADLCSSTQLWDVFNALPSLTDETSWITVSGSGIEIQCDGRVVETSDGSAHYVELDSHANEENGDSTNSSMVQGLELEAGEYYLTFHYQPRTATAGDNTIEVNLFNLNDASETMVLFIADDVMSETTEWVEESVLFTIDNDGEYGIQFTAGGIENTLGGFIDNVSLHQTCTPPPGGDGDGDDEPGIPIDETDIEVGEGDGKLGNAITEVIENNPINSGFESNDVTVASGPAGLLEGSGGCSLATHGSSLDLGVWAAMALLGGAVFLRRPRRLAAQVRSKRG